VNDALPGKVGGMDVDFVINQAKTHRLLHIEQKPKGARISVGASLTYREYVRAGFDAWAMWDMQDGTVRQGFFDANGRIQDIEHMEAKQLASRVRAWWDSGLEEE
jgi:hypothetical protein